MSFQVTFESDECVGLPDSGG